MDDPNQPSWLSESGTNSAPAAAAPAADIASSTVHVDSLAAPAAGESATALNAADEAELPGVILTMRLANMGVAIALVIISVFGLIGIPGASTFVLSIYAMCGGLLICCLETQLKFLRVMIAVNFGFLFSSIWRFMFYLLLASICISYDNLRGIVVAVALVTVALYNTYVLCRYPTYRRMREKIAEEEDKRIEARISKEVKKQVAQQAGI